MNAVCLIVAGVVRATLPTDHYTLAWQHSVEKTRWEESYRIDGDRLRLTAARIQGLGAGMEPPRDAVLRGGWWTLRIFRADSLGFKISIAFIRVIRVKSS